MTFQMAALVYLVVFVLLQIGVHIALRSEATAHGQDVGRLMGCIIGILWPIALVYFLIVAIMLGTRWLWSRGRCDV